MLTFADMQAAYEIITGEKPIVVSCVDIDVKKIDEKLFFKTMLFEKEDVGCIVQIKNISFEWEKVARITAVEDNFILLSSDMSVLDPDINTDDQGFFKTDFQILYTRKAAKPELETVEDDALNLSVISALHDKIQRIETMVVQVEERVTEAVKHTQNKNGESDRSVLRPKDYTSTHYPMLLVDTQKNNKDGLVSFLGFLTFDDARAAGAHWQKQNSDDPRWNVFYVDCDFDFAFLDPAVSYTETGVNVRRGKKPGFYFRWLSRNESDPNIIDSITIIGPFNTEEEEHAYARQLVSVTKTNEWKSLGYFEHIHENIETVKVPKGRGLWYNAVGMR